MLEAFGQILTNPNFYANVLAVTPPSLFAALGCAIAEKASATNMGMEGIMLISSFCGTMASYYLGPSNPWAGLLVSIIVGAVLGYLVAFFALKLKVDIILVGIAMNLLGSGGTAFFLYVFTGDPGASSLPGVYTRSMTRR